MLGAGDVLAVVQQGGEFAAVVLMLVLDERVCLQDRFELAAGAGGVAGFGELGEVAGDLPLVPGGQEGLDVGEVSPVPVRMPGSPRGLR